MKKLMPLVFVCLSLFFSIPTASAASHCYSPAEVQAEQLLRLHSELMVITVTCRESSEGENLVPAYTGFTRNNISALHEAEQTMIRYYKAAYGGNGITRLDRLRTLLANEYGQEIANVSAPAFCAQRRDKVVTLFKGSPEMVQGEVTNITARTYAPPCGKALKTAQKSK
jgi:hypothetical protein